MYDAIARGLISAALAGGASPRAGADGPTPTLDQAYVVAIDAGHGGDNAGCLAHDGETAEKALTMDLALALRAELQSRIPGIGIVFTREGDETVSLEERVHRANESGAALLVSLHFNASAERDQEGFETYVLEADKSAVEAARVTRARRDNTGEQRDKQAARRMLQGLALHAGRSQALRLAQRIQAEQAERFPDRVDRGVREGPYDVLIGAKMPAVLFEAGFVDTHEEGDTMLDAAERKRVAEGLADAIVDHYREVAQQ